MWSFYTMIGLTDGHNAKPIFCCCHSWFDICVMEQKQWGLIWLVRLKGLAFASHVSEKEGDGSGLDMRQISQFLLAQIRKIRKNRLKPDLRVEQRGGDTECQDLESPSLSRCTSFRKIS